MRFGLSGSHVGSEAGRVSPGTRANVIDGEQYGKIVRTFCAMLLFTCVPGFTAPHIVDTFELVRVLGIRRCSCTAVVL